MEKVKVLAFARTTLKNLFQKPATVGYPFAPAVFPERMRGHVEIEAENCILCGMCMRTCPPGAIKVDRAAATWTINRFDCVQCGSCTNACPKKCLKMAVGYTEPGAQKQEETFQCPKKPAPAAKPAGKPAAAAVAGKTPEKSSEQVPSEKEPVPAEEPKKD